MRETCETGGKFGDEGDRENLDDEALALKAHEGAHEARNQLFLRKRVTVNRLGARARRYLARLSSLYPDPPITDEDIEHQSFIIFCALVEQWEPESSTFSRFLIKKLPSHLLHYVRDTLKPQRRGRIPTGEDDYFDSYPAPGTNPEERLGDLPANWQEYTADLPYNLRVAVTLRYWADLPSTQIAGLSGHTRRTVDRDLRRAREIIKRRLEQQALDSTQKETG